MLEIYHQVIANPVCTFDLQNNYIDGDKPCSGILVATDFAVRNNYLTMLQEMLGQLVSRREIIINTPLIADWGAVSAV